MTKEHPLARTYKIKSNEEVSRLLRISTRHLNAANSIKTTPHSAIKIELAIVSSVFSAAAIETGLNVFLTLPVLFIKDNYIQNLYGSMLNDFKAIPAFKKVALASRFCSKLKGNRKLIASVNDLFAYRNKILHVSPTYAESMLFPHKNMLLKSVDELSGDLLERRATIVFEPPGDNSQILANEHLHVAEEFLSKLVSFEKDKKCAT